MENEKLGILQERYQLVARRIREIPGERLGDAELEAYFSFCAEFLMMIDDTVAFLASGGLETAPLEELKRRNHALYADILPGRYEESYANPTVAVRRLGRELGQPLCVLYAELRSLIGFAFEGRTEELVIRMELFAEIYGAFCHAAGEGEELPSGADVRRILYWFVSDYSEMAAERSIRGQVCADGCFRAERILSSDLRDERYLYSYGEYVGSNELQTAGFINGLSQETILTMAGTYTEGYRMGFEVTGKDLSKKGTVGLYYHIGFERMLRQAVKNFAGMGLRPVVPRASSSMLDGGQRDGRPNRQFCYDHKDDKALFLDKNYVNRRLEVVRAAYERYREQARAYGGPAVVETFGEADFSPVIKEEALKLSPEQNRLWVEYRSRMGELQREYIPEEERSFTIIAFPVPEIGPVFEELFQEIIRINTLDYMLYRRVQQTLIDALDKADYCEVRGMDGNRTQLRINLFKLGDPEKETIFENCVADVNIPVGEVFTSPVLRGTEGVLHVKRVFLNGLEYRDLELSFQDGMISGYSCDNYDKDFLYENILFRHETLPMGEFAIGTNTVAYVAARRLGVEAKLPILIAEKMGPHFAVGDTCYSHAEEVRVYNPDGKEIVAKANEISDRRRENPAKAYFNCHTDITIPYDELGELTAVEKDGRRTVIIKEGRFVLPGCEELNRPF